MKHLLILVTLAVTLMTTQSAQAQWRFRRPVFRREPRVVIMPYPRPMIVREPVYVYQPAPPPQTTIIYEPTPAPVVSAPPVAISNEPVPGSMTPPNDGRYYFCESSQLAYPYARSCSERWKIYPQPPIN